MSPQEIFDISEDMVENLDSLKEDYDNIITVLYGALGIYSAVDKAMQKIGLSDRNPLYQAPMYKDNLVLLNKSNELIKSLEQLSVDTKNLSDTIYEFVVKDKP